MLNEFLYLLEYERNGFEEQSMIRVLKNEDATYVIFKPRSNYIFRDYLPDPNFWISTITGIIWNNYGITLIINDHINGWSGEWSFINNQWNFIIDLPDDLPDLIEPDENQWDDEWAEDNFAINLLKNKNQYFFIHADVKQYLKTLQPNSFDLVIIDPPTFSNSKRMKDFLDIQRDHVELLNDVLHAVDRNVL